MVKPLGSNEKIGAKNSIEHKSKNSKMAKAIQNNFDDADELKIPDYIEEKYGAQQGRRLCWMKYDEFAKSMTGEVKGYSLVIKDEDDQLRSKTLANPMAENQTFKNFFVKNELVLASIDKAVYDEKNKSTRELSLSRRSKPSMSQEDKRAFKETGNGYGVKAETVFSQTSRAEALNQASNKKSYDELNES